MKKAFLTSLVAGIILLLVSVVTLFLSIRFFPQLSEEYFSPVFRNSTGGTDWMYYAHPFILAFALKWFWERYKGILKGNFVLRALEVALVYGIVAMLPVLWITYSSIDISFPMVATWLLYGIAQAFIAGLVFAKLNP